MLTNPGSKNKKIKVVKKNILTVSGDNLLDLAFNNSLQTNIVSIVSSGKIIKANSAACKLLGYTKKELLSKSRSSIFDINDSNFKKMLKQRTSEGHSKSLVTAIKKKGKQFTCEITSVVFADKNGIENSITTLVDMSQHILEQKNIDTEKEKTVAENILAAKEKSALTENNFYEWKKHTGKTSYDIMWDWDIKTDLIYIGESVEELFGYVLKNNTIHFADFVMSLLPDEKDAVEKKIRAAFKPGNKSWNDSFMLRRKDGTIASTTSRAIILRNEQKKVTHLIGATKDLSSLYNLKNKLDEEIALRTEQTEKLFHTEKLSYDIIWDLNILTEEVLVSDGFKELFGYSIKKSKIKLSFWNNFIHPHDKISVEKYLYNAINSSATHWEYTYRIIRADSSVATVFCRGNIIRREDGKAYRMIGVLHDISNQKILEEKEKRLEEKMLSLSQAVEQSPSTIVITDTEGTIQYVNQKFVDLTGYSFKEAVGANPRILKSGEKSDKEYKQLWQSITSEHTWHGEFHNKKKNGELYWESAIISPIKNAEGKTIKFLAIKEDITERKKTENALAHTSDLLDRTSKLAKVGGWELDLKTMDLLWTSETYRIHDIDPLVKPSLEMAINFHPSSTRPTIEALVNAGINKGIPWDYEFPMVTAKGRKIWVRGQGFPINKDGKPIKIIGTFQDITERKQTEKQYSDLFDMSPQPMWLYDLKTLKFIRVNKAAVENYGYNTEEFLKMTVMDIRPKTEFVKTKIFIEYHKKRRNKNFSEKFTHHKKSGELIDVEIFSTTILLDEKEVGSVIAIDITEKNRFEQAITKAILKTQEDERYEIGGELHDNICQILAASKLSLGMMGKITEPTKVKLLNQSIGYITLAIEEIRNLSHRLAPVFFEDATLEEACRKLFNDMNVDEKYKIKISFDLAVKKYPINLEMQLNLYRIMQEQLKNILKYSKATSIKVDLFIKNKILCLRIVDNGVGFNADKVKGGIGLANIKRRTELFSGKLQINSSLGNGCIIEINIPLVESPVIRH